MLSPTNRHVPMHYSPVRHSSANSKLFLLPFDLHVLSIPPAFNLSQDQTLQFKPFLIESNFITESSFVYNDKTLAQIISQFLKERQLHQLRWRIIHAT